MKTYGGVDVQIHVFFMERGNSLICSQDLELILNHSNPAHRLVYIFLIYFNRNLPPMTWLWHVISPSGFGLQFV
jgi:hypothetical protein